MTHIEELSGIVNRLKALLDDPHPGLATWRAHYNETVREFLLFFDAAPGGPGRGGQR